MAQAPVVTVNPYPLMINYVTGTTVPTTPYTATVVSNGASVSASVVSLNYYTGQPTGWLTPFPPPGNSAGSTPATLNFYLNSAVVSTLPVGTYEAQMQLSFSATLDPSSLPDPLIVLNVLASGGGGGFNPSETITTSPTTVAFVAQVGGSAPTPQTLAVTTSDAAGFTVTAQTNDGNQWLSVSPSSVSSTPANLTVSVNPGLLPAAGNYTGTITIVTPSSNIQVPVSLSLGGTGLTVMPTSLTFNVPQNFGFGAPQYIQVTATGTSPFSAQASSDFNWLVVDTPTGTTPGTVTVRANDASLMPGTYMGSVTVQLSPSNLVQIPTTLTVGPPATLSLAPSSLSFTYTVGGTLPASQTVAIKSLNSTTQSFSTATSTTDGAAWLTASATSPTPGSVSVSVNPTTLVPGSYTGVVNVTPSITGASPEPIVIGLTVVPAPTPTVVSVVSAASYAAGTVAPGEFVVLFGSALGPATLTTPTPGTAPDSLGGTTVTFDGIPAPILYASATQTSVQVPYGIAMPQTVLKVTRTGVSSVATTINSVPAYPGLFTQNASGKGQVAALNADGTLNGPSNPALRGSYISLYGTGEGITNPASVEGTITPSVQPLPMPLFPVMVTFSGATGPVLYAGETPTALAGLMQINVTIPQNSPTGPAVSVLVSINGQTSPGGATVAIQ